MDGAAKAVSEECRSREATNQANRPPSTFRENAMRVVSNWTWFREYSYLSTTRIEWRKWFLFLVYPFRRGHWRLGLETEYWRHSTLVSWGFHVGPIELRRMR